MKQSLPSAAAKAEPPLVKTVVLLAFLTLLSSCTGPTKQKPIPDTVPPFEAVYKHKITVDVDEGDTTITKTGTVKDYKIVAIGNPDYKGRYYYEYAVYKTAGGKDTQIKNSDMFTNIPDLEGLLNGRFKALYDADKANPAVQDCMQYIKFHYFDIDDMGISFNDDNEMEFNVEYEASSACMNVSGGTVAISQAELEEYLK